MLANHKATDSNSQRNIHVLTIDDHPIFRQGIHHLLEGEEGINPAAEVASIQKALDWLAGNQADVILLDHNLTDTNGVDAIPQLLEAQHDLQIIMLTVSDDNEVFLRAIRNGACGYVLKDSPPEHIIEAIQAAKSGECHVSDSLVRYLFEGVSHDTGKTSLGAAVAYQASVSEPKVPHRPITEREKEVLQHLVKGLSNKEIAKALQLSPNTVRNQLQKLQDVFNARNRVQLALFAYDAGIGGIR